jgi:hypothetical protein
MSRIAAAYASDDAWVGGLLLVWGLFGMLITTRGLMA